jgi:asparagine synthase (glutamine-hydrolysing)
MCGIAGAVGDLDPEVFNGVRRISTAQFRRGPDASGEWTNVATNAGIEKGVFFAHQRLKIIDLHDSANQPFVSARTSNTIIFNGEIYNFIELRTQLTSLGHSFTTDCDTEVLLAAYDEWGAECVSRLSGMFAFAIWDKKKDIVFAARDRVGIKPFYYTTIVRGEKSTVLIASQIRGLLASELVNKSLNPRALSSYLWNGFVVGPDTLVEGIHQLLPGHTMTIDRDGNFTKREYWQLPRASEGGDPNAVKVALEKSVRQHMVSDVPVGIFLSGGKDSSAVATMASRLSSEPVKTFTITFEEAEFNEAVYAKRVADCIKSDHQEVLLSEKIFRDQLDDALGSVDQPTFDGINSYFVSNAVKQAGLTVALAGTGGDELFGGYTSFKDLPKARSWSRRLSLIPNALIRPVANGFSRVLTRNFGSLPPQTRWGRLADAIATEGEMAKLYQVANGLFTMDFYNQLKTDHHKNATSYGVPQERMQEFSSMVDDEPDLHAVSKMEISMFLGERLLRDTDAASMENSLEVRVPLIDHDVIEALFAIDQDRRFQPVREKPLLREMAMWDLPDYIFDRPKLGFELPLDRWCRQGLKGQVGSLLTDANLCESIGLEPSAVASLWEAYQRNAAGLHWSRIWGIYVLLWWCKEYGVTQH